VALKFEDRNEFKKRTKLKIMPHSTNIQFIDALLLVNERNLAIRKVSVDTPGDNNRMSDQKFKPSKIKSVHGVLKWFVY
jgi:hypothetical protein